MRDEGEVPNEIDRGELALDAEDSPSHVEVSARLVSTSQAARIAGVSKSTIIRNRAELGAVLRPHGDYLFDAEIVRRKVTVIRKRQAVNAPGPTSGEVAAAVFAALKEGKAPSDIVIELRVQPEVVIELKGLYEEMSEVPKLKVKCRCGNGKLASSCSDCVIGLDLGTIEARISPDGKEEVRLSGQVVWGRLPEKRPGRVSELAAVELHSDWVLADSEDARDLREAQHGSRKRR
jgi:hypothetical protein